MVIFVFGAKVMSVFVLLTPPLQPLNSTQTKEAERVLEAALGAGKSAD